MVSTTMNILRKEQLNMSNIIYTYTHYTNIDIISRRNAPFVAVV